MTNRFTTQYAKLSQDTIPSLQRMVNLNKGIYKILKLLLFKVILLYFNHKILCNGKPMEGFVYPDDYKGETDVYKSSGYTDINLATRAVANYKKR